MYAVSALGLHVYISGKSFVPMVYITIKYGVGIAMKIKETSSYNMVQNFDEGSIDEIGIVKNLMNEMLMKLK